MILGGPHPWSCDCATCHPMRFHLPPPTQSERYAMRAKEIRATAARAREVVALLEGGAIWGGPGVMTTAQWRRLPRDLDAQAARLERKVLIPNSKEVARGRAR